MSFFLCGIVVHYVASEANYKPRFDKLERDYDALENKYDDALALVNEKELAMNQLEDDLKAAIRDLEDEKNNLQTELSKAQARKITLEERVNSLAGSALGFEGTVADLANSLDLTKSELKQTRTNEINLDKQLKQVTSSLEEKITQLDAVERERKRLLEANKQLEDLLGGKAPDKATAMPRPITTLKGRAKPLVAPQEIDMPLRGLVTAVDSAIATISIGSADGVGIGARFHVVRNGTFICDVVITDVDSETAAGTIKLKQQSPRAGDKVSTDFEF